MRSLFVVATLAIAGTFAAPKEVTENDKLIQQLADITEACQSHMPMQQEVGEAQGCKVILENCENAKCCWPFTCHRGYPYDYCG
eukprot:Clim_evm80s77 gene=Clim_evmTU80s77